MIIFGPYFLKLTIFSVQRMWKLMPLDQFWQTFKNVLLFAHLSISLIYLIFRKILITSHCADILLDKNRERHNELGAHWLVYSLHIWWIELQSQVMLFTSIPLLIRLRTFQCWWWWWKIRGKWPNFASALHQQKP